MTRTKRMTAAVLALVLLLSFAGCGAKNALFDRVSGAGKFAAESLTIYEEKGSFAAEPKTVRDAKQAEEIFGALKDVTLGEVVKTDDKYTRYIFAFADASDSKMSFTLREDGCVVLGGKTYDALGTDTVFETAGIDPDEETAESKTEASSEASNAQTESEMTPEPEATVTPEPTAEPTPEATYTLVDYDGGVFTMQLPQGWQIITGGEYAGYIENRILAQFRGTLGNCLEALREQQYESIPTVTELIEKEDDGNCHIFESILQIMLSYVKFGEIKYGDAPLSDERIQVVFKLIYDLDAAIVNPSGKERLKVVNLILVRCWDYIEDFLEICKKRQEEAKASGSTESLAETIAQILQAMAGSSVSGEGSSTPIPEVGAVCVAAGAGKRAQTAAQAEKSESEGSSGSEEPEPQTDPESEGSSAGISQTENSAEEGAITGDMEGASDGKQTVSAEEDGRIPYQQTDRVSEGSGGATKHNEAYERERYGHAAEDIERLLDKMAEKAACEQLENERTRELNDVAQSISYGDVHAGVDICVNRISTVDEELVEQYNAISGPLLDISRQLQKSLLQQLKDKQRGGKQTGLMMGRRLDAHALCRNDGKVFYKNALPNEIPQMSVGLLLDESGSMCSCDRCTYARSSAIILYDFCKALHIPVTVYGHSTSGNSVELYSYAEFESIDNDDKYRMMDIAARGSNRDGAALRFVAEQLVKRPEEVKILILVSDGQPAAPGYYGSAAEEDLRGIRQEYRRKGVLFIAAAIGEDKQNIERIYGDSFMDITDLNQLPVKLTAAVKRHMRV